MFRRLLLSGLVLGMGWSITPIAHAEDPRPILGAACSPLDDKCQRATFTVSKTEKIAADYDFDTGWLPKDSAVQVRILTYLHGRTRVDMTGTLDGTWPDAIRLRPEGKTGTGVLSTDDGFVVRAMGRFKVKVAGKDYGWEGDLPGLPSVDLGALASTQFDPWAWKDGTRKPISTSATSPKLPLYKLSLTDKIIPIPGIGGGFDLDGQAEYTATYQSLRIAFDELVAKGATPDVTPTSLLTKVAFSSSPALDTTVFVHGEVARGINLHFIPGFYIEILGKKFELDLADIPINIPGSAKPFDFDGVPIRLPLPRLEAKPSTIDLGEIPVGKATSVVVSVFDTGLANVNLQARTASELLVLEKASTAMTITPGVSDAVTGKLTPVLAGPFEANIELLSNDPASPKITVRVKGRATGSAATPTDPIDEPGTSAAGSCTCRVGSNSAADQHYLLLVAGVLVGGLAMQRRRNRCSNR